MLAFLQRRQNKDAVLSAISKMGAESKLTQEEVNSQLNEAFKSDPYLTANDSGVTPLIVAAYYQNLFAIRWLKEQKMTQPVVNAIDPKTQLSALGYLVRQVDQGEDEVKDEKIKLSRTCMYELLSLNADYWNLVMSAAKFGNLDFVKWFFTAGFSTGTNKQKENFNYYAFLIEAHSQNHLHIISWFMKLLSTFNTEQYELVFVQAVKNKNHDLAKIIVRLLNESKIKMRPITYSQSKIFQASEGDAAMFAELMKLDFIKPDRDLLLKITEYGNLDLLKQNLPLVENVNFEYVENGCPLLQKAAEKGHAHIVSFLIEEANKSIEEENEIAAYFAQTVLQSLYGPIKNNHLETLKLLLKFCIDHQSNIRGRLGNRIYYYENRTASFAKVIYHLEGRNQLATKEWLEKLSPSDQNLILECYKNIFSAAELRAYGFKVPKPAQSTTSTIPVALSSNIPPSAPPLVLEIKTEDKTIVTSPPIVIEPEKPEAQKSQTEGEPTEPGNEIERAEGVPASQSSIESKRESLPLVLSPASFFSSNRSYPVTSSSQEGQSFNDLDKDLAQYAQYLKCLQEEIDPKVKLHLSRALWAKAAVIEKKTRLIKEYMASTLPITTLADTVEANQNQLLRKS